MSLSFPNPSRSYIEAERGVWFWGYDQAFEVSFFIGEDTLSEIKSETTAEDVNFLQLFDTCVERIREVAGIIYARRQKASHVFSFTLLAADFH